MYRYTGNRQKQKYDIATQKLRAQTRSRSAVFDRSHLFMGQLLSMPAMGLLAIILAPASLRQLFHRQNRDKEVDL
jgi:hypothetical protein